MTANITRQEFKDMVTNKLLPALQKVDPSAYILSEEDIESKFRLSYSIVTGNEKFEVYYDRGLAYWWGDTLEMLSRQSQMFGGHSFTFRQPR